MKKLVVLLLISSFGWSCSLDLPVEDEITGLDAIDNVLVSNETLSGIYRVLPKNKIMFSILADDFYPNHNILKTDYRFYLWDRQELIIYSDNLWGEYYDAIAKANVLLKRIPLIINAVSSEDRQQIDFIHAQTLALKALAYFDLLQIYAPAYSLLTKEQPGIILKNKITKEELPRSTVEKSYQEIGRLLLKAIGLFPEKTKTYFRFSKKSAQALLAKTYFNWHKYNQAVAICDELLNAANLNENHYSSCWKNPRGNKSSASNPEVLLAFENEKFNFNYGPIVDNITSDAIPDMFYTNPVIKYSDTDYRKKINLIELDFRMADNSLQKKNFLGKSRTDIQNYRRATPIMSIRQAELYFIKAESLYKLNREEEAKNVLNTFLNLRKATNITSVGAAFLSDLLREKQKEFVGEGVRYFDAKRNHIQLKRVNHRNHAKISTINKDDYRWLIPLPRREIQQNKNAKQNPGW